jgi:hypothetical protein
MVLIAFSGDLVASVLEIENQHSTGYSCYLEIEKHLKAAYDILVTNKKKISKEGRISKKFQFAD